jgi:ABC-2 type transport system permease protein
VIRAASPAWFARHELRIAWREWQGMMTANNRRRLSTVLISLAVFFLILHLPAYVMVGTFASAHKIVDKATLLTVTISLCLYGSLMLSQAMESVTRAFYARADLDLVLSSPVPPRRAFAVRIAAIAFTVSIMAVLLAGPFVNVLAIEGGPRWLSGYGLAFALGAGAASIAVALTVALFRLLGPRRTRLIAQIVAAVVGAATVIGIQVMAILRYGTLARPGALASDAMLTLAPEADNPVWLPARAVMGDLPALAAVAATCLALLAAAILAFSGRFGEHALAASSIALGPARPRKRRTGFSAVSAATALRRKEWRLLRRDPWLTSQTLTQLLYLLPPALLLSRNFGGAAGSTVIVVLVLVTVAGQLAGGLAWLAISGEDAPDMVASAPIPTGAIRRAKVEAVMGAVAVIFAPILVALAFASLRSAYVAGAGIALATVSSIQVQLWFQSQARRSHFRRRHVSSRVATFAEAFSSFAWAGAAGLAASGAWQAAIAALFALLILAGARAISPRKAIAA